MSSSLDMCQEQEETTDPGQVSVAELDQRIEQAVRENERSERLLCEYLVEMNQREGTRSSASTTSGSTRSSALVFRSERPGT